MENQFDDHSKEIDIKRSHVEIDSTENLSQGQMGKTQVLSGSTRFESSERTYQEELSLKNISQLIIQNWALFLVLFVGLFLTSLIVYKYKIPFQSKGSIIINDSKNSALQSFSNQYSGQNLSVKSSESKKSNSSVLKNIEYLSTADFLTQLIQEISERKQITEMNMSEKKGYDLFFKNILQNKFISSMSFEERIQAIQKLDSILKINLKSDYESEVIVQSLDKNLAYFISKNSLLFISNHLKNKEKEELSKIKNFLSEQKNALDLSIRNLNKQISEFQAKPENLISLSSGKVGDYLSELMVRKNELRMKISENNKIIETLAAQSSGRRDSALYGNSGKINLLKSENEMLLTKMNDLQKTSDLMMSRAKAIPTAQITFEELKKKSDLEFENYKSVSLDLSKIEASQLALENKFEILELPRLDKVKPLISIVTLFLLCILLSQIIGSIIIYIRSIWDTKYVTAEQTRNIVVIDGHSLDPRVIIENSKIKFSLQNAHFNEDSINKGEPKKLSFSFNRKKAVNDQSSHESDK